MPVGPRGVRGSITRFGSGDPSVISTDLINDTYVDGVSGEVWAFDGVDWNNTGFDLKGEGASNGTNAYLYIGYASDDSGTGYSATPSDSLTYIALKQSTTVIASPNAATFTGLWVKYLGTDGTNGDDGKGYFATSATSFAIGTGSKSFTTQANLAYAVGSRVRFTSAGDTTKFMEGTVTAYSGTTLVATISDTFTNTGTFTDWNIAIAGEIGQTGFGYKATSTTTITAAVGSKTFTTQIGLAYVAGDTIQIKTVSTATTMAATVTSYAYTTGVMSATVTSWYGSSANLTNYTISLAGLNGEKGDTGAIGTGGIKELIYISGSDTAPAKTTVGSQKCEIKVYDEFDVAAGSGVASNLWDLKINGSSTGDIKLGTWLKDSGNAMRFPFYTSWVENLTNGDVVTIDGASSTFTAITITVYNLP